MAEAEDGVQEVEVDLTQKKIRARGYDVIVILMSVVCGLMLYMMYQHKTEAKDGLTAAIAAMQSSDKEVAQALREIAATNRALESTHRVTNCLISRDSAGGRMSLTDCERIAR